MLIPVKIKVYIFLFGVIILTFYNLIFNKYTMDAVFEIHSEPITKRDMHIGGTYKSTRSED